MSAFGNFVHIRISSFTKLTCEVSKSGFVIFNASAFLETIVIEEILNLSRKPKLKASRIDFPKNPDPPIMSNEFTIKYRLN
jgi:hypothetical protein